MWETQTQLLRVLCIHGSRCCLLTSARNMCFTPEQCVGRNPIGPAPHYPCKARANPLPLPSPPRARYGCSRAVQSRACPIPAASSALRHARPGLIPLRGAWPGVARRGGAICDIMYQEHCPQWIRPHQIFAEQFVLPSLFTFHSSPSVHATLTSPPHTFTTRHRPLPRSSYHARTPPHHHPSR